MANEKENIYSLHRYVDENGVPDYDRIFSHGDSKFWIQRHLDPWLLGHLENQPDIVKEDRYVNLHMEKCKECNNHKEPEEQDLPFH